MVHSSRTAKRLRQRATSQARTEKRPRIVRLEKKRRLTPRRLYASERAKAYYAHDEVIALAQGENETRVRRGARVGGSNP